MVKDIGIKPWGHRHKIRKIIEEIKEKPDEHFDDNEKDDHQIEIEDNGKDASELSLIANDKDEPSSPACVKTQLNTFASFVAKKFATFFAASLPLIHPMK